MILISRVLCSAARRNVDEDNGYDIWCRVSTYTIPAMPGMSLAAHNGS
jgi:hypothetical protein